ncbi:MAG: hypothetical protein CBB92_03200 [Flammeovirgaceae bacterium TMED32]|jgi:hypothetical protein|nr:MAG: hypothetical protein CBB92_03200 [Flammeovirgaceae bacterium TMED32]
MFAINSMLGMNFAPTDPCFTPPALAPIPYPNIAVTSSSIPAAFNVFTVCAPQLNMLASVPVSTGDNTGVGMGVASGLVAGPQKYTLGCFTTLISGSPAVNMTKMTIQNSTNAVGLNCVPSQPRVLILS